MHKLTTLDLALLLCCSSAICLVLLAGAGQSATAAQLAALFASLAPLIAACRPRATTARHHARG